MPIETSAFAASGVAQAATPEMQAPNPVQVGLTFLKEQGITEETAGVMMVGPFEGCNGTLAAMMGVVIPGHEGPRNNVQRIVAKAIKEGRDPNEAVLTSMDMMVRRDENDEIMRVSPEDLKKNGGSAGS